MRINCGYIDSTHRRTGVRAALGRAPMRNDDDAHDPTFLQPEDWPVDLRIAAVVALWLGGVIVAAFLFVRLIGL